MTTEPHIRRLALASATLVLAAAAAGCTNTATNTRTTPAVEWAEGVCSAMTTYNHSLASAGGNLGGMLSTDPSSAVSEAKRATKTFTSDLDDLGKPDTKAGAQAKDAINELAVSLGSDADEMERAVRDATGLFDDPTDSVGSTLEQMVAEVSNTFKTIDRLDANIGLAKAKSCTRSPMGLTLTFTSKNCVVATVTNIGGGPVPHEPVNVSLSTPDGTQMYINEPERTNSAGRANFCIASPRFDYIGAFVDPDGDGQPDPGDPEQTSKCPASRRCGRG